MQGDEMETLVQRAKEDDLRAVCLHEAGHAAVARHFLLEAEWFVESHPDGNLFEHKFYTGQTNISVFDDAHIDRMIGLAGTAAEAMRDSALRESAEEISAWLYERLESKVITLSEKDAAAAGDFDRRDVLEVVRILQEKWAEIRADVVAHLQAPAGKVKEPTMHASSILVRSGE